MASSATPLTFWMEDNRICNSVCLRYVDDKKLSVFQSNVKYLKLQYIQKYLILVLLLVKWVSFTSLDEDNIYFAHLLP